MHFKKSIYWICFSLILFLAACAGPQRTEELPPTPVKFVNEIDQAFRILIWSYDEKKTVFQRDVGVYPDKRHIVIFDLPDGKYVLSVTRRPGTNFPEYYEFEVAGEPLEIIYEFIE